MFLHVIEARHVRDYILWLRFNNGVEGEIDLDGELFGDMFLPLRDPVAFAQFRVDPELQTIAWANGADLAPEFLFEHLRVPA